MLAYPIYTQPFIVETDASHDGLAAVGPVGPCCREESYDILYQSNYYDNLGNQHLQRYILPASIRAELLNGVHDQCGHQRLERTEQLVLEHCWWPR